MGLCDHFGISSIPRVVGFTTHQTSVAVTDAITAKQSAIGIEMYAPS